MRAFVLPVIGLLLLVAAGGVRAANQSDYTKVEDEKCTLVAEYEAGATSVCEGFAGIWYEINDGDARVSVTAASPRVLSERALADLRGLLLPANLYRLMKAGRLRYTLIGRRRLIPADALRELVNNGHAA